MPGGKRRLAHLFTGGVKVTSGSVAALMKEIWAGSVAIDSPSFAGGAGPSRAGVSTTVTGLNASMMVFVKPASFPGGCVYLVSSCAITNSLETTWALAGASTLAAAASQVTLHYLAIQT